MARIKAVEEVAADSPNFTQGATGRAEALQDDLAAIFGHRPLHAVAAANVYETIQHHGTLSERLKEMVRLRIAFHNQCRTCMAMRYSAEVTDDGLVCSLERPEEAPHLTDAERVALHFADLFATNHLAIDDAAYDALREYFEEGELVELGILCAYSVGFGRLAATWHVVDNLPEGFKGDDVAPAAVTPWGQAESIDATERNAVH
jgi:alkylhydroperoxidase family enzyme